MSNMPGMTEESKAYILGLAFKGETPADLWMGLALVDKETVTLMGLMNSEPNGATGYERRRLDSEDWSITNDLTIQVESVPVTFRNAGSEKWPSVNVAFLATSKGADGVLVAWSFLTATRDLFANDELITSMVVSF